MTGGTLRLHDRLDDIPAEAWDALHDASNPFVAHAFLAGLERHGCLAGGRVTPFGQRVATMLRALHGVQAWQFTRY